MAIKFVGDYYFSLKEFKKAEQYYSIFKWKMMNSVLILRNKKKMKLIKNG